MSAMKFFWILVAVAVPSFGQTSARKATAPSDTWQRSKECASQAEKLKDSYVHNAGWTNHYSPKYEKCFALYVFMTSVKDEDSKDHVLVSKNLIDAFEQSDVASADTSSPPGYLAKCSIGHNWQDCEKVIQFIDEHMKN
jgi:hypothetical protein